ncbi:glutamate synthases, NADH/NADPH, small subunit [Bacteroidales bacterium 6E]|nr:glutamate synthases, NADH/NADPH, small subunit [Bacteroidales bacterium 6E]
MGNPKGFMMIPRKESGYRPVKERIFDYGEVEQTLNENDRKLQASRCMDCGVPFCHWGCPVGSKIPEWQDSLYKGNYDEAYRILHSTNSFPEITGRVCPAPCEKSCVLNIHEEPVTIRENECATVETAFDLGLIVARPPRVRTGKKVAVIGSGPAGLSAADKLNQAGHTVTVFEKNDAIGGLLRYGIPDFKLSKNVIDRRLALFLDEGITFKTNTSVGTDITSDELLEEFDAVVLAIGAEQPRDLTVEGRELGGVHFAMEYLTQQNKIVAGVDVPEEDRITAKAKKVLVIGGGDTGSDCVGTAIRQRAEKVTQIEILPRPADKREPGNPWPYWPNTLRTSSSHLEGCERRWSLSTKRLIGENGTVTKAELVQTEWFRDDKGRWQMSEVPGTEEIVEVDLVLLAMGFTQPVHQGLLDSLGVDYDPRNNVKVNNKKQTSKAKVFAAGDVEKGASLVVHAIEAGKVAAAATDAYLRGMEF